MKTFEQKVSRRIRWWAIASTIVLLLILSIGWALLSLADDVGDWFRYLAIIGSMLIVLSFFLGQATERILVRSWDTWVAELGPVQAEVLIQALKDHVVEVKHK